MNTGVCSHFIFQGIFPSQGLKMCLLNFMQILNCLSHQGKPRNVLASPSLMKTKVHIVKATFFSVVMYGCQSWTIKKVECRKINAFKMCCRRLSRDPWKAQRSNLNPKGNQLWVFIGRTGAEAEVPILWPPDVELTHWKRPWLCETLRAGGERGNRGWDGCIVSLTQWTLVCSKFRKIVKGKETWHAAVHGVTKNQTWLINQTTARNEINEKIFWQTGIEISIVSSLLSLLSFFHLCVQPPKFILRNQLINLRISCMWWLIILFLLSRLSLYLCFSTDWLFLL